MSYNTQHLDSKPSRPVCSPVSLPVCERPDTGVPPGGPFLLTDHTRDGSYKKPHKLNTLLSGEGYPIGVGTEGDYYFRTDNMSIYGPKTSEGWGLGASLIGPPGMDGQDGMDGQPGPVGPAGGMGPAYSGAVTSSGLTMSTNRLLGRTTAGTGSIEEITVGTGLTFAADNLSVTGAPPTGSAGGDLGGTYPNPTVVQASTTWATTGIIYPPQLTANQTDYNPTGLSSASVLRLDSNADGWAITTLAGGSDGRRLTLVNESSYYINLGSSVLTGTASMRFTWPSPLKIIRLGGGASVELIYDGSISNWRLISPSPMSVSYLQNDSSNAADGDLPLSASGMFSAKPMSGDATITSAGVLTVASGAIGNTKFRNSGALSVIGRSANSTGNVADISATAASDAVLRESGSTVGFGTIATGGIANSAVTYAKVQNVSATSKILGRKSAGAGVVEECALSDILDFVGSAAQGDILYRGASTWTRLGAGTSGQWLQTQGASANPQWATITRDYVKVSDQKTSGTAGGTFTSGSWQTRTINTEDTDTANICSIASNQITLAAGTYECNISAPCLQVALNQVRLQNITDSTTTLTGQNANSGNGANYSQFGATVCGRFTIAAQKTFEVQHRCSVTQTSNGFGLATSWGTEIYTVAEFWRVG